MIRLQPDRHWVWLPLLRTLEIVFVSGLAFVTSSLNVFIRDTPYVVGVGQSGSHVAGADFLRFPGDS